MSETEARSRSQVTSRFRRIGLVALVLASILIACGWYLNRSATLQSRIVSSIRKQDPEVRILYDFQLDQTPVEQRLFSKQPSWLGQMLGVDWVHTVRGVHFVSPASTQSLEWVTQLGGITELNLEMGVAEVDGWEPLYRIGTLEKLNLFDVPRSQYETLVARKQRNEALFAAFRSSTDLQQLARLKTLSVNFEFLSVDLLAAMLEHPGIEELQLQYVPINLNPLVQWSDSAGVKRLFLEYPETQFDSPLPLLERFPRLEFLSIRANRLSESRAINDAIFESIAKLEKLNELFLYSTHIKGTEIHRIRQLPLTTLALGMSDFNDRGLEQVGSMASLRLLELGSTLVTDAGMKAIADLANLEVLSIRDTAITDEGLMTLTSLKNLKILRVRDTPITDDGVQQFRKLMPECFVEVN